jgi:hypothetical protein
VDGTRFDQLIKIMATTRITRLTALRGLAVGAVGAAIGFAAPDEADAKCKNCDQCQKKVKKRTNSGKVRCRCRAKANGTLCSIPGATTATTCLNGACIAAVSPPVPPVPPPPGPSQICTPNTQMGCTGGQVCNAAGTACVNCISDDPCGTEFDCVNGRCVPATPRD